MQLLKLAVAGAVLAAAAPCQWTSLQGPWWSMSEHGLAWCPNRGALISFGGMHTATTQNVGTRTYRGGWQLLPTATTPYARGNSPLVTDEARKRIVLHGGRSTSLLGPPIAGDTWEFDGVDWQRIYPANSPGPLFAHGMTYDAQRQVVVLFGGLRAGFLNYSDETWEYDGLDWTQVTTPTAPDGREGTTLCFDPGSGNVLMFGGRSLASLSDPTAVLDVWQYDGADWTQLPTPSVLPSQRFEHAACYDPIRDAFVLFGGKDFSGVRSEELWVYERSSNTWTQMASLVPTGMSGGAMAYDVANRRVVLSGGRTSSTQVGQTGTPNSTTRIFGGRTLSLGVGCAGSAGVPRLTSTPQPRVGHPVRWRVDHLEPSTSIAVIAFSAGTANHQPLDPIGMPGCVAILQPDVLLLAAGSGGHAEVTWNVPNVVAAIGDDVWAQAFCLDLAANAAGATTSGATRTFLGY